MESDTQGEGEGWEVMDDETTEHTPLPNRPVPTTPRQFAEELLRRCWSSLKPKGTADCKAFLDEAEKVFAEAMASQAQSGKK